MWFDKCISLYTSVYYINYNIQKLAQIDQRERNRHEQIDQDLASTTTPMSIQTKPDEIILLEKQGLCSQKLRNNLAQVTHTIGQNMTDISNIDNNTLTKVERIFFTFSIDFVQFLNICALSLIHTHTYYTYTSIFSTTLA